MKYGTSIFLVIFVFIFMLGCSENINQTLPEKNKELREVHYSYVVPVNRTIVKENYPIEYERAYQMIYIDKIGNTNLSFWLHWSSDGIHTLKTCGIMESLFYRESSQYFGHPKVVNIYYCKIAYDRNGKIINLNYTYGDVITILDNKSEVVYSGRELKDWNVKLILAVSEKEYQINFTILEPIPVIEE